MIRMFSMDQFSTHRLTASRLSEADFDNLYRMNQTKKVMATLGGVQSADETRQYLHKNMEHWNRYGYGVWTLTYRTTSALVGRSAVRNVDIEGNEEREFGYALMPEFWGVGLATEISQAMVQLAFKQLGFENLVAFTLPNNFASRRVIEKVGGKYERNIIHAGQPHVLYRLHAAAHKGKL